MCIGQGEVATVETLDNDALLNLAERALTVLWVSLAGRTPASAAKHRLPLSGPSTAPTSPTRPAQRTRDLGPTDEDNLLLNLLVMSSQDSRRWLVCGR
jgi:hypothetical protein